MMAIRQLSLSLLRSDSIPKVWSQVAWTLLRVVAGAVMIHNGQDKLADIEGFAEAYVEVIGLPFPIFFAYCAAFAELIGAPLLALGLLTRPAALTLFGTMAVAIYHHILVAGFSIPYLELSTLYAATFLCFAVNGAGQFSIDQGLANLLQATQREQQIESLKASYQATEKITQVNEQDATASIK